MAGAASPGNDLFLPTQPSSVGLALARVPPLGNKVLSQHKVCGEASIVKHHSHKRVGANASECDGALEPCVEELEVKEHGWQTAPAAESVGATSHCHASKCVRQYQSDSPRASSARHHAHTAANARAAISMSIPHLGPRSSAGELEGRKKSHGSPRQASAAVCHGSPKQNAAAAAPCGPSKGSTFRNRNRSSLAVGASQSNLKIGHGAGSALHTATSSMPHCVALGTSAPDSALADAKCTKARAPNHPRTLTAAARQREAGVAMLHAMPSNECADRHPKGASAPRTAAACNTMSKLGHNLPSHAPAPPADEAGRTQAGAEQATSRREGAANAAVLAVPAARECNSGESIRPFTAPKADQANVPDAASVVAGPFHSEDEYEQEVDQPLKAGPQHSASTAKSSVAPPQPDKRTLHQAPATSQPNDKCAKEPRATPVPQATPFSLRTSPRPSAAQAATQGNLRKPNASPSALFSRGQHPLASQQAAPRAAAAEPASLSHFNGAAGFQGVYPQRTSLASGTVEHAQLAHQPWANAHHAQYSHKAAPFASPRAYTHLGANRGHHLSNFSPFLPQQTGPAYVLPPTWYGGFMLGYPPLPVAQPPYPVDCWNTESECETTPSPLQSSVHPSAAPRHADAGPILKHLAPSSLPAALMGERYHQNAVHGTAAPPPYMHVYQAVGYGQAAAPHDVAAMHPPYNMTAPGNPHALRAQQLWQQQAHAFALQQQMGNRQPFAAVYNSRVGARAVAPAFSYQARRGEAMPPSNREPTRTGVGGPRSGVEAQPAAAAARGAPGQGGFANAGAAAQDANAAQPSKSTTDVMEAASDGWSSAQSDDGECCAKAAAMPPHA